MQYLGGKSRIAKAIVAQIRPYLRGRAVWDPFCGGLSISAAFGGDLATDVCAPLIYMYQAVQRGWVPPDHVTREQYQTARDLPDTDPMKAFCGFGCSFGGKWFGGWARHDPRPGRSSAASNAKKLLQSNVPKVRRFGIADFLAERPRPLPLVIYCDPPYRGTTEYSTGAFDSDRFWERAEGWSRYTDVFVSEYSAPIGRLIWEKHLPIQVAGAQQANPNTEKLFRL